VPKRHLQPSDHPAVAFNDAINRRDLDGLGALMSESHTFIDADDKVLSGKHAVLDAWRGFFTAFPDYRNHTAFPDYRNHWSRLVPVGSTLIAVGRSVCATEPALEGPAIWRATTAGDKVAEWRVYADTPANRRRLGIARASD
jgi:ketosteroid isomerase-like protein